jgi:alanyl-tRNA synthetase
MNEPSMPTVNDIRSTFLDYFGKNDHAVLPSSPLVPHNDPTLMFTAAGMVQFKNIFSGTEKPASPRAATAQKCVRAGGKHNDLDNVGYTARHHTFFEMLGNFSFGDYFKERAITHAWELMTKEYGISPEKLGVTVYHTDDEAFELWRKIAGLPESKILRVPTSDNFWSAGDTGPCGPCTEIFYDHGVGEGEWALDATGHDKFGGRFVEVWNLVFMQYEALADGSRINLPKPSIDTGMGLERISAVLQGKHNNFDIDLFQNLIRASESLTSTKAEGTLAPSHRIIADHLRASVFLMSDGVMPSNEGRGYVLRRIMRRAMRHAHMLGAKEPLMHRLVPALVAEMGEAYPELKRAQAMVTETLRQEEERFKQTLERGLKLIDEENSKVAAGGALPGEVAFKLYDTYGFPLDLTQDIMRGQEKTVDTAGFDAAMAEQKARAREAWKGSGEAATSKIWFELREQLGATEFLGYALSEANAQVVALVQNDAQTNEATAGDVWLLANQTPFYGESGGQIGDTGSVLQNGSVVGEVVDTIKPLADLIVHKVKLSAPLKVGSEVQLVINTERRAQIRANHSATHILHAVLRNQLGEHISQKGSYVGPDRLRFDISHGKALTKEEISAIEAEVNRVIWQNSEVGTRLMSPEAAIEAGAMALFGEKYGEEVRVLNMGLGENKKAYSVELCGGTHVAQTGDIGLFKIVSESALAAGIRRIEALTRDGAMNYLSAQDGILRELAQGFKTTSDAVPARIDGLQTQVKQLEKDLSDAKRKLALAEGGTLEKEEIAGVSFAAKLFDDVAPNELRPLAEQFLTQLGENGVLVVATGFEGKASLVVAVNKAISTRISAVDLVRAGTAAVGGKGGGGRPDMAQAGGPDGDKLNDAVAAIRTELKSKAA